MTRRQAIILALYALAEASIIEPLVLLFPSPLRNIDNAVALIVTWALLFCIALSRRWMAQRDTALNTQRLVVGGWLVGMLVISIALVYALQGLDPRDLAVLFVEFAAVVVIWWRGVALGVTHFEPDSARLRLQLGILIFVGFGMVTLFTKDTTLLIFMMPFLVGAAFAMPLSHIERVENSPIGRPVTMDRKWWRSLILSVGAPVALCLLAALLINGEALAAGVRLLVIIVLLPIIAVAFVFGFLISLLASLLFRQSTNVFAGLEGIGEFLQGLAERPEANGGPGFVIPPEVRYLIGLAVLVGIILLLIWLTGRARREETMVRTEYDNLIDLGPTTAPPVMTPMANLFRSLSLRRWLAALTIRRIYARMDHEATKRGYARRAAETPFDHLPLLDSAFPTMHADVRIITDAYVKAHYGEVPDTDEALNVIRDAWERVRATPRPPPPPKPDAAPARG